MRNTEKCIVGAVLLLALTGSLAAERVHEQGYVGGNRVKTIIGWVLIAGGALDAAVGALDMVGYDETVGAIEVGLGVAAVGTGVILLVTRHYVDASDPRAYKPESAWQIAPTRNGARVSYRF